MTENREGDTYETTAGLYDHVGVYRDRADVPFFVEAAASAGGPVLELGCGTGRILVQVARAGIEITGMDLSSAMLGICRERLLAESEAVRSAVRLVHADMRDFALDRKFNLAMFPFRSFQHLMTVEDQLACLRHVHDHLVNGGRVILDVFNPSIDSLANRVEGEAFGHEPEFETPDGRRIIRSHRVVEHDRFNQVNHFEHIHSITHPDGRTERLVHAFSMRYLFRFELEHLLARCGFDMERVYSGYDRSEYGSRYPGELVMVARKSA